VELRVKASYKGVKKGESIALNGACLTVEKVLKGAFTVHAVQTTLGRTLIGEWKRAGASTWNARCAPVTGSVAFRAGPHRRRGSVEGVAEVDDAMLVDIRVPPEVAETTVLHGAITVDGVSLTVNAWGGRYRAGVAGALTGRTRRSAAQQR